MFNAHAYAARENFLAQRTLGGVVVDYEQGGETIVGLNVNPGRVNLDLMTTAGIAVDSETRDFLILAEELVLGGKQVRPERGAMIHLDNDLDRTTFELAPLSGTDRIFSYSDSNGVVLRVHAKRIKVSPL